MVATLRRPGRFWLVREAAVRTLCEYLEREGLSPQLRREIEGAFLELLSRNDAANLSLQLRERLRASLPPGGGGVSGGAETTKKPLPLSSSPHVEERAPPSPSLVLTQTGRNPRVNVTVQGRGEILLELFALDAPRHVARFMDRVQRRYYDGGTVKALDPSTGVLFADAFVPSEDLAAGVLPGETFYLPYLRGALLTMPLTAAMGRSLSHRRPPPARPRRARYLFRQGRSRNGSPRPRRGRRCDREHPAGGVGIRNRER